MNRRHAWLPLWLRALYCAIAGHERTYVKVVLVPDDHDGPGFVPRCARCNKVLWP